MPELPELQIIAEHLTSELAGFSIKKTVVHNHIVVHGLPVADFEKKSNTELSVDLFDNALFSV